MLKLSAVIITLNEEKNIGKCLHSLQTLTDDIVVVDSGSTDKTEEICKQYNVKFFVRDFDDYSSQKNYGNSFAKYDYILSIDADEVISEKLRSSIEKIEFGENEFYGFNLLNHYCGKPIRFGGWYPDKKYRIWNKNYGKWEGKIHEKIVFSQPPKKCFLKGNLLHFTYESKEIHKQKTIKYAKLMAKKDFENGKNYGYLMLYLKPIYKFISMYIIKLGFLDGKRGFLLAKTSAYASFVKVFEFFLKKKHKNFCI